MNKSEQTFIKLRGCEGCRKNCKYNHGIALKERVEEEIGTGQLYGCNSTLT